MALRGTRPWAVMNDTTAQEMALGESMTLPKKEGNLY